MNRKPADAGAPSQPHGLTMIARSTTNSTITTSLTNVVARKPPRDLHDLRERKRAHWRSPAHARVSRPRPHARRSPAVPRPRWQRSAARDVSEWGPSGSHELPHTFAVQSRLRSTAVRRRGGPRPGGTTRRFRGNVTVKQPRVADGTRLHLGSWRPGSRPLASRRDWPRPTGGYAARGRCLPRSSLGRCGSWSTRSPTARSQLETGARALPIPTATTCRRRLVSSVERSCRAVCCSAVAGVRGWLAALSCLFSAPCACGGGADVLTWPQL